MTNEEKTLLKNALKRIIVYIPLFTVAYATGFYVFQAMIGTAIGSRVRGANSVARTYGAVVNCIYSDDEEFEKAHNIAENCTMYGEWLSNTEMLIYQNENFPEDTVVDMSDYYNDGGQYRYFALYTERGNVTSAWCSNHPLTAEELTEYSYYKQKRQVKPINPSFHPISFWKNAFADYSGLIGWSGG